MEGSAARVIADSTLAGLTPGAVGLGVESTITAALSRHGTPDPVRCGQLFAGGRGPAEAAVAAAMERLAPDPDPPDLPARASAFAQGLLDQSVRLTGAEAVAVLLAAAGVRHVFAYAGTSELSLCDAVDQVAGIDLVNGRGDKESGFMAAGASLLEPCRGAAILHGARGLTNTAGALADARRNEVGTVYVVGLPSTGSMRFLPPHGEAGLIRSVGHFARWDWEAGPVPAGDAARREAAALFVQRMRTAIRVAGTQPWGPVLFGIPQDVAEARWLPLDALTAEQRAEPVTPPGAGYEDAVGLLAAARRPVFLLDDYALRSPGLRPALARIGALTGAPVLQVRYRRGPMLFERLHTAEVPNFVGWLNQYSAVHRSLLADCDLLVTVEDRNIYRRVVGDLPGCRKLAITTDPAKVFKNEYLGADDLLVPGDPATVLTELGGRLAASRQGPADPWFDDAVREAGEVHPEPPSEHVRQGRQSVAAAVADLLAEWPRPVLVDDSQMFGGLLAEHYDMLPRGLRIFGDHGGFVGGGLAYAIGLAVAEPAARVLCTLGDQAFTNSFQALVAAVQQRAGVLILVCNNGQSVSLNKQAAASFGAASRGYLANSARFDYQRTAQALGVSAHQVTVRLDRDAHTVVSDVAALSAALQRAAAVDGPALVELVLPADPVVWQGIWLTQGFEQVAASVG